MPMPVPFLPYLASGMDPGTLEEIGQRWLQQGRSRTTGPGTSSHTECQSAAQTGELRDPRVLTRGGSAFSFSTSVRIMQESHDESIFTAGHQSILQKQQEPVRSEKHRDGYKWEGMGCKTPQSPDPAQKTAWMLSGATQGICARCPYSMFFGL